MLAIWTYSNKGKKAVFEMENNVVPYLSNGRQSKTVDMGFDHSTSCSFSENRLFIFFLLQSCFQRKIAILGFQKHWYGHFSPTKKSSKNVSKSLKKLLTNEGTQMSLRNLMLFGNLWRFRDSQNCLRSWYNLYQLTGFPCFSWIVATSIRLFQVNKTFFSLIGLFSLDVETF